MKLSKTDAEELRRMFLHFVNGKWIISSKLTTNRTQTTLQRLQSLERRGAIRFDEQRHLSNVFGVRMWECELTDAGREFLKSDHQHKCADPACPAKLPEPEIVR